MGALGPSRHRHRGESKVTHGSSTVQVLAALTVCRQPATRAPSQPGPSVRNNARPPKDEAWQASDQRASATLWVAQVTWRPAWPWAGLRQSTDEPIVAPIRVLTAFPKSSVLVSR